jgi:glycosyltransferase involved in cell wall biosynthesis
VAVHVHEAEGAAPALVRRALAAPLLAATVLLVNSRYSLQVLAGAVPALGRRGRIVPNGVAGPPAVVPARRALEAPVRLVYVGRLSPRKGVDVAVEAAAELARRGLAVRLDVVGSVFGGYEWFESDLRERVRQAGLADAVAFHGFQDDVWAHLAHADVVLVPSRLDEPFGNTAVEAALAARPVVVSDTSGLREAAADLRAARRVAPGDAAALADAVAGIAAGWEVARQQAAQDADVVARRHAPAGYRARIVEAMSGLLSRPAATRGVPAPRTQGSAGMAAAGPAAAETVPGREGRA